MAHILILDDDKSIRHSLKEILEYESYKVDEAPDGIEGIKMAEKTILKYCLRALEIQARFSDAYLPGFSFCPGA